MVVDSGTPPTLLPEDFYDRLVAEVREKIPTAPIEDDPSLRTQLCYKSKTNLRGPILMVHFEVYLRMVVLWELCPLKFLVGYDRERMIVSFKRTDCTK
ncbi:hypothetical protein M0R45_016799 [Rubus argutus]|uniref:Xylanase inhibitor C-terminal domain-containing protein n=1 Tax=Rubus argutus TaxID=59490 RepID=A0AAW1XW43_RUBAR